MFNSQNLQEKWSVLEHASKIMTLKKSGKLLLKLEKAEEDKAFLGEIANITGEASNKLGLQYNLIS